MNINLENDGDKIIVKVTLSPYRNKRREPTILREVFDCSAAYKVLKEKGYIGYTLHKETPVQRLDNKFTSTSGIFVFTKEKKQIIKKKQSKKINNYNLDNQEKDVIESTENTVEK